MAAISSIIAAVGLAATAVGQYGQYEAGKDAAAASRAAEDARRRQENLKADAERRRLFRDAQAKAAVARANANAAGADAGGSSGLAGGLSQITSGLGQNISNLNQNQDIGNDIFAANAQYSEAKGDAAMWSAVGSVGQDVFKASDKLANIGSTIAGTDQNWTTTIERG